MTEINSQRRTSSMKNEKSRVSVYEKSSVKTWSDVDLKTRILFTTNEKRTVMTQSMKLASW